MLLNPSDKLCSVSSALNQLMTKAEDHMHSFLGHQQAGTQTELALQSRVLCKCCYAYLEEINSGDGKISKIKYQLRR